MEFKYVTIWPPLHDQNTPIYIDFTGTENCVFVHFDICQSPIFLLSNIMVCGYQFLILIILQEFTCIGITK